MTYLTLFQKFNFNSDNVALILLAYSLFIKKFF